MDNLQSRFVPKQGKLEVCIDSLESAINAIHGGAHELELCSSLVEGGLTPSAGLVVEIINMVNNIKLSKIMHSDCGDMCSCQSIKHVPKLNIMIRCRGGADFCYTEKEMQTMMADLRVFKKMSVDRFVFGALTDVQGIDDEKCSRIIAEANPIPVTFHRAFDLCSNPLLAIKTIIGLGFSRVLTSGQRLSASEHDAVELIKELHTHFGGDIEIMPGSGVNLQNVRNFIDIGCKVVHSSCKVVKDIIKINKDLGMGSNEMYVTNENMVRSMVEIIEE